MPLYEYKCKQCGHRFELLLGGNSKDPERCPSCSAPQPEKLFSSFAVGQSGHKSDAQPNCANCSANCPYARG